MRRLPAFLLPGLSVVLLSCGDDGGPAPRGPDGGAGGRGSGGAPPGGGSVASGGTSSGGKGSGGANGGAGGLPEGGATDPEDWGGCPAGTDYPGDAAWPHRLAVAGGAVYCAAFNEERSLVDELAAKAMLRVAPGSYPLPGEDRAGLGLPVCFRFGEGAPAVAATGGDVSYEANGPQHSYRFTQQVASSGPQRVFSATLMDSAGSGAPAFSLDGSETDFQAQDAIYYFSLCPADGECAPYYGFDSCTHAATGLPHRHRVTLDSGTVTFELNVTPSFSSTEPASFVRASGIYRGVSFDQRSYWRLVYSPAHHHFVRRFAVLFDAPIEGACGISVRGLEPGGGNDEPDVAAAVDCDLRSIGDLEVQAHEHEGP